MLRAVDRTERLLDLVALLLDTHEPISWAKLREAFPEDYGKGSDEAAIRKFERDKAELLELGIPLQYRQNVEDQEDGYAIDRDAYYLPETGLTPEELAVLYAAGSAALSSGAFPGRQDLAHALRKMSFFAGTEVSGPRVRLEPFAPSSDALGSTPLAATLETLWNAIGSRKSLKLTYRSPRSSEQTERSVQAYGLALRGGVWTLVGHCQLRTALRTFHVHRIRSVTVNASKPKTPDYEIPADFRIEEAVGSQPWEHRFHAPEKVRVVLTQELARLADRLFPGSSVVERREGATELEVAATYVDGLVRYALSLGPDCRVTAPAGARGRWRQMAERTLAVHGGAARGAS